MINVFLVKYREEKDEVSILNLKAQTVKDVVLKKLRDRLQRRGMSLQDYLIMSKRKSMMVALTLRDFCKVRYEIRSESLNYRF